MREYLANLYEPGAVRETFVDDVGDAIDCVAFRAQPAFRLRDVDPDAGRMPDEVDGDKVVPLLDGETSAIGGDTRRCADGTVSLRHYTLEDLVAYGTLDRFLQRNREGQHVRDIGYELHEHAANFHFAKSWGASTTLNLWNPPEIEPTNFSLSQMWVVAGERPEEQTVEAGWIATGGPAGAPHLPRLFVYTTSDGYRTGCHNAECGRFVKMPSSQIVLDGAWTATSAQGGPQFVFTLRWQFCPSSTCGSWAGWWLKYETAALTEWVGFYPRSLFDSARLADGATQVSFGGEIFQQAVSPHTSTDMGSGRFPETGFGAAAYQRSLRMISPENAWQPITDDRLFAVERPDCYLHGGLEHSDDGWGDYFFFGGPGRSETCR